MAELLIILLKKEPEVCWRSARGVVDWIVAAPSTYKGWLLEVCQRSAGNVPSSRANDYYQRENARREVLFTHCGLKVHSHYSV